MKIKKTLLATCIVLAFSAAMINYSGRRSVLLLPWNVLSYYKGDCNGDGIGELLVLFKSGEISDKKNNITYGDYLYILPYDGNLYGIKKYTARYDLSHLKPMSIKLGDVNGDGIVDISVMVYKTAEFHPVMDKRPFFYYLENDSLVPLWKGSRLSHPFLDYVIIDLDGDSICEIVSAEYLADGTMFIAAYKWHSFGFDMSAESEAFDEITAINIDKDNNIVITMPDGKKLCAVYDKDTCKIDLLIMP